MADLPKTVRQELPAGLRRGPAAPGVLIIFSGHQAKAQALRLSSTPQELGRGELAALGIDDERTSRRHVGLSSDGLHLRVEDLGSTNGLWLNGHHLERAGEVALAQGPVVRLGHTLLLGVADVAPSEGKVTSKVRQQISALARTETTLALNGERGCGQALLARLFVAEGRALTQVLCTADPEVVRGRLFLEGRRALRPELEALFLDELDGLTAPLQSALLHALSATPELPVVSSSRGELREAVAEGRLSAELFERIGRPSLRVPPLRERREEISLRVVEALAKRGCLASVELVERCLMRAWPGNEHELERELSAAAAAAQSDGAELVHLEHLDSNAGLVVEVSSARRVALDDGRVQAAADRVGLARKTALKLLPAEALARWAEPEAAGQPTLKAALADALLALLERHDFQQAAVAQELDLSRTTLLKVTEQLGLPRAAALTAEEIEGALSRHAQDVGAAARALRVSAEALRRRLARRP